MAGRTVQLTLVGNNTSAIKAIDEIALASEKSAAASAAAFDKHTSKIGGLFRTLDTQLGSFGIPLTGALGTLGTKFDETGTKSSSFHDKLSALGGAALVGAAVGLTAVGVEAVHMADAFEASHARLETAVHNIGQSFDDEKGKISDADQAMEKLGFTNADTENSLSRLVVATHDVGEATKLMGLSADIARARGIDLASATDLLVKVEAGRYAQLSRLGIATAAQVKGFKDSGEAIDFLTQKFGGQAQAYAKTFAGELQTLKATGEDLATAIGLKLIPVIQDSVGVLNSGVHAFEDVNAATDGWLGKLALATAAVPIAVFAYDKLSAGLGGISAAYGRAATAVGLKSAADETAAESSSASVAAMEGQTSAAVNAAVANAQLTIAQDNLATASGAVIAAQAAVDEAIVEGSAADADAVASAEELVAANRQLTVALAQRAQAQKTVDALTAASATAGEAVALEKTTAAAQAASVQLGTVGSEAGLAAGSLGGVGLAAAAAFAVAAVGGRALADALDNAFGEKDKAAELRKQVTGLSGDLVETATVATAAKDSLSNLIGPAAAQDLQNYANEILAGADAHTLAATKAQAHGDVERSVAEQIFGTGTAAKLTDEQLQSMAGGYVTVGSVAGVSAGQQEQFAAAVQSQTGAVDSATSSLDELIKKYGEAGAQTAILLRAQNAYANALASGHASDQTLAADRAAVIDASKKQATTQQQVNTATKEGADAAKGNAGATKEQTDAQKAADAAAKQLSKDLDDLGKHGSSFVALAKAMHLPDDAVKNLTSEMKSFEDATKSSFDHALDAVDKFADKSKVSFKDFAAEELKQLVATQNWATNLGQLADLGLNKGLLLKLDQAGPKSAGLVQAILDNVNKGSISSLNALAVAGDKSMNDLNSHLDRGVAESETHFGAFTNAANRMPTTHQFTFGDNASAALDRLGAVHGSIDSLPSYRVVNIDVRAHVPNINIGEITYDGVAVPIHQGPFAQGGDLLATKGAALVGEEGPELFVPKTSGVIIPHPITDKLLSHKELSTEDWLFLKKHGVGGLVGGGIEKSKVPHFAQGGEIAPFGAGPLSNSISVTFGSSKTSSPVTDSTNAATQALDNFISTATQQLPTAGSAIGDFAQHVSTDMQNVKTATDDVNKAFRDYHQSIVNRNQAGRQVEADERDQARLIREHADAIHLQIAAERLKADQEKFDQLKQAANTARGQVLGAQTVEAQAKATLAKQLDPANFIRHVLADTNEVKIFEADLSKLLKEGDANLARALATAGPSEAFQLAEGFARDKAKADAAEKALAAEADQTKDYNKFLKTLGIAPKATGGHFNAGDILLVGEKGPEFVQFPRAGSVTPNHQISGGDTVTIHAPPNAILDGRWVIAAMQDHCKTKGPIRFVQFAA